MCHCRNRAPRNVAPNPVGLKGVGEAGCIPTGALFAQAVEDALAGSGVEITEIPLSPNTLFELIERANAKAGDR
jgi:carbon-monoxide dehydrogenase large subunit